MYEEEEEEEKKTVHLCIYVPPIEFSISHTRNNDERLLVKIKA
jgi:hypothetical protein